MLRFTLGLMQPFRSLARLLSSLALVFVLGACAAGPTAGLQSYQSPDGRFAFLYPTGWTQVQVSNGPRVVFHDLIHSDETVSLMVNKVDEQNDLDDLGSAVAVGERLRREVIATVGSGRTAELIEAGEREMNGRTFYDLEYAVHLPDRDRHELATVVVDRGRLYTLATSVNEDRWEKVQDLCGRVVRSLTMLI
jgi:photosystem II oxygen-evolving enhancer protein 2